MMATLCAVCRYEPAVPGFDLGEKCMQLTLELGQPDVESYPRWPVVEESEWWARRGRSVVVVAHL